jgi:glycosyltransferase involved in cell wall biosynthesis
MSKILSIVVPTRNVMDSGKLREIFEGVSKIGDLEKVEVLVTDFESKDGLEELVSDHEFVIFLRSPEVGTAKQINYALKFVSGDYVLFNHARSVLSDYAEVVELCKKGRVDWGFFFLRFDHKHWFLKWVVALLSTYLRPGLGGAVYLDQCNLVRSEFVKQVGGFPELDLMEDVEFSKRLRKIGLKPSLIDGVEVETSAYRFLKNGIYRQHWRNMYIKTAYWLGWKTVEELEEMYK